MSTALALAVRDAFTVEEYSNREDWLKARRTMIGASESAAVLGISPFASPFSVYASKIGAGDDIEATGPMRLGSFLEEFVAREYAEQTGVDLDNTLGPYTILRSRQHPFLGATLDRRIKRGGEIVGLLECKAPLFLYDWLDDAPRDYKAQVTHQLIVTEYEYGALAGVSRSAGKLLHYDIPRDLKAQQDHIERLTEFWLRTQRGEAPPTDGSEATSDALARLYPENVEGELEVELDESWLAVDEERAMRKESIKAHEARIDEIDNALKAAIGKATRARLPNGESFSWVAQTKREHIVKESTYRVLRKHKAPKAKKGK